MGKSDLRLTINLSEDLAVVAEQSMKQNGFRSHSENYASHLRYQAISGQPHALTADWAALSPAERDRIDAGLRQLVESGDSACGSWLKAQIYEAIKEICADGPFEPTILQTMEKLPDVIRKSLEKRKALRNKAQKTKE